MTKNFDLSGFKISANNNIQYHLNDGVCLSTRVEKIVRKRENAGNQDCLLFP